MKVYSEELASSSEKILIIACDFVNGELSEDNSNDSEVAQEIDDSRATLKDNRLEGKFVSKTVINLFKVNNFASFKRT